MNKTSLITGEIIQRLNEADIKPRKLLGQNFLINAGIYQKIVAAARVRPSDTVLEVGPGLGILTDYLLAAGARVIAVEKDKKLAEYLGNLYRDNGRIEIVTGDVLKFSIFNFQFSKNFQTGQFSDGGYKIVGNIPYYLTSRLLKTVFEKWPAPRLAVFLLQKEVAQRIVAKPPQMSLLAVSVQYFAKPEIVSYVSRGSFYPMPKVDSAIIRLRTNDQRPKPDDTLGFFRVVRAGFAGKRKQLINNLSAGLKTSKKEVAQKLRLAGIAPTRRAETLSLGEWAKLAKILAKSE